MYLCRMLKIIADSGSTKTAWALSDGRQQETEGINPVLQDNDVIQMTLNKVRGRDEVDEVFFYGAGVRPEQQSRMKWLLDEAFPKARVIEAESDMLGAARALCQHKPGVACILGTGANSCKYDGEHIIEQTPSMGYILDDYGGGSALGRMMLLELYKGTLIQLEDAFEDWAGMRLEDVIECVYRQPNPNRFLASLAKFAALHADYDEDLYHLIVHNFSLFIGYNLGAYDLEKTDSVHFAGGLAYTFREQLYEACELEEVHLGRVIKHPITGLQRYHFGQQ